MFGLIGKLTAVAGQRDALAAILLESARAMHGPLPHLRRKPARSWHDSILSWNGVSGNPGSIQNGARGLP